MIIGCIGIDEELRERLRSLPNVTSIYHSSAQHIGDQLTQFQMSEVVLLSDTEIPLYELETWAKKFEGCKLGYLVSYTADISALENAALLCKRLGIVYLAPSRTVDQLADAIGIAFFDQQNKESVGKVVAFVGTLGQTGVTATVLSLAEQHKKSTKDLNIGVLGFNCENPGDKLFPYHAKYLNDLVQSKELTSLELKDSMQQYGSGVYYLAGNNDLTKKYRYPTELIAKWIQIARQTFDIVLIDAGCTVDNNLCLQALISADLRVVVTTNQLSAISQWQRQSQLLRALAPDVSYMLLVNKTSSSVAKQLQQALKLPLIGWLPTVARGIDHEQDQELLIAADQSQYSQQMIALTTLLQDRFHLMPLETVLLPWWKRRKKA